MTSPKYMLLIALLLSTNAFAQNKKPAQTYTYNVSGTLHGLTAPFIHFEKLGVQDVTKLDSVKNTDGKFAFTGSDTEPGLYRIRTGNDFNQGLMLVLSEKKNDITIQGAGDDLPNYTYKVSGSKASEQLRSLLKESMGRYSLLNQSSQKQQQPNLTDEERQKLQKETEALAKTNRTYFHKYTDTVKNPIVTIFATLSFVDPEQDLLQMKKVKERLKQQGDTTFTLAKQFFDYVNGYADAYEKQAPTAQFGVGSELPDIALADTSGNVRKLSALRGKYVLVDFWASWCGPCRMENPNVVEAFNKFKDKNFTVFNVSLDTDRNRWAKAIRADKLAWEHHVSELKGWNSAVCKQFSVFSIPANFLIDPQGKVIATNLRGEDLQTTLASLLQ